MKDKMPSFAGRNEWLKHRGGKKLTRNQAIKAKCYDCMGYYVDGKCDCKMPDCSLYLFNPYRSKVVDNGLCA